MSEYDVLINKYDALKNSYDQLYPKPMKHADTHANGGTDPITPGDIGAYSKNETDTLLQNKEPSFSVLPLNKGGTGANNYNEARENLGFKRVICPAGQSVSFNLRNEYTYILSASSNEHQGIVMIQTNSAPIIGLRSSAVIITPLNWSYSVSNGVLILSETGGSYGAGIGVSHIAWNQGY